MRPRAQEPAAGAYRSHLLRGRLRKVGGVQLEKNIRKGDLKVSIAFEKSAVYNSCTSGHTDRARSFNRLRKVGGVQHNNNVWKFFMTFGFKRLRKVGGVQLWGVRR